MWLQLAAFVEFVCEQSGYDSRQKGKHREIIPTIRSRPTWTNFGLTVGRWTYRLNDFVPGNYSVTALILTCVKEVLFLPLSVCLIAGHKLWTNLNEFFMM